MVRRVELDSDAEIRGYSLADLPDDVHDDFGSLLRSSAVVIGALIGLSKMNVSLVPRGAQLKKCKILRSYFAGEELCCNSTSVSIPEFVHVYWLVNVLRR